MPSDIDYANVGVRSACQALMYHYIQGLQRRAKTFFYLELPVVAATRLNGLDVALLLNPIFPGSVPREMKTYLQC